jgi:hypothetical protein
VGELRGAGSLSDVFTRLGVSASVVFTRLGVSASVVFTRPDVPLGFQVVSGVSLVATRLDVPRVAVVLLVEGRTPVSGVLTRLSLGMPKRYVNRAWAVNGPTRNPRVGRAARGVT